MRTSIVRLTVVVLSLTAVVSDLAVARGRQQPIRAGSVRVQAAATLASPAPLTAQSGEELFVEFQRYDNSYFVKNTSGLTGPTSFLVINNRKEFEKVFGPAATMGKNDFLPSDTFEKNIVVAAIKSGPLRHYNDVRVLVENGGVLRISYVAKDSPPSGARFRSPLIISVEKGSFHKVVFVEDGKEAASLPVKNPPDIYGFFFIKDPAPHGFADIDVINLGGSGQYGAGATPPFYGLIRLKNGARTDYKLMEPAFDGNNVTFKTRAVRGVSYEFEGTFSRLDFIEKQQSQDEIVLSGTLKKLVAGKVIAHAKMDFTWSAGG